MTIFYQGNSPNLDEINLSQPTFNRNISPPNKPGRMYTDHREYPLDSLKNPLQLASLLLGIGSKVPTFINTFPASRPDLPLHRAITNTIGEVTGKPIASFLGFSAGKEGLDAMGFGTPDFSDVGANLTGATQQLMNLLSKRMYRE